ncbi:MAG: RNA-binding protein [Myxococcota bacterium]
MSKKLFVGGISWGTSDDDLRSLFSQFSEVLDAKVILDRDTGRSRGFGFVTLGDDDAARRAMEELDGSEFDGRRIRVNEAEEKPRRSGGGGGGGGGGGWGGPRDGGDRGGRGGGGGRGDRGGRGGGGGRGDRGRQRY